MITGLWNGISGVHSQQEGLSVQSNNITNVNTVGYKEDTISFQDLIYEQGRGNGASTQLIEKNFEQGNIQITNNSYDFAINGKGFFIVEDQKTSDMVYSRAGNFRMGTNGNLVTAGDNFVHGLSTGVATAVATNPDKTTFSDEFSEFLASQDIVGQTQTSTVNAKATDYTATAIDTGISGSGFKTANALISDVETLKIDYQNKLALLASNPEEAATASTAQTTEIPFSTFVDELVPTEDGTHMNYIQVNIDGNLILQNFNTDAQTTMNKFSDKISATQGLTSSIDANGLLTITSLIPGEEVTITDARINQNAPSINITQEAIQGTGQGMVDSSRDALQTAVEAAGAEFLNLTNGISFDGQEALTTTKLQLKLDTLGFSTEGFGEIEVNGDTLYMKQDNNKFVIGSLSTAYFNNLSGLKSEGGNNFSATSQSGDPLYAGNINEVANASLETSNTDIGLGLTDLMVYQRAFEASAKSITTSDEFLKTAIQLKS